MVVITARNRSTQFLLEAKNDLHRGKYTANRKIISAAKNAVNPASTRYNTVSRVDDISDSRKHWARRSAATTMVSNRDVPRWGRR